MKRLVFILSFFIFITCANAAPVITNEFYLNNGEVYDSEVVQVSSILPNTLRLVLSVGERSEVRADVMPKGATSRELSWSLPDRAGKIEIYPNGEVCTVVGIAAGEEKIRLEAENGTNVNVFVEVKEAREIRGRSFEYEGERKTPTLFTDAVMRSVVRVLITAGAIMVFLAVIIAVKRRREDER